MAEVRHVADRLTIFRNGRTVAAHETNAVSDDEIVTEMIGRHLDRLYPERIATATDRVALRVSGLSAGQRLRASISTSAKARCSASAVCRAMASASCSRRCSAPAGRAARSSSGASRSTAAVRASADRPRRHRAGAGGSPRPGPAPDQKRAREPDAVRHPALLAERLAQRRKEGAGQGDGRFLRIKAGRPSSLPVRCRAATSRR